VGNALAEQQKPPSDEELRKAVAEERTARERAEQERDQFRSAAANEWRGRQQAERELAATRQPRADAFESLAERGVAVPPDEQRNLLDRGVRERTREEIGAYDEQRRREEAQRIAQMRTENSLTLFAKLNPGIVEDEERFSGAIQQAQHRARKQRLSLDADSTLELAKKIYLEDREKRGEPAPPPFTEGASMPGGRGQGFREQKEEPPRPSMVEEAYGLEPGTIVPDTEMDDHTERYIDERNLSLSDKEKFSTKVRQIAATMRAGQQRRAANAGR
jgi:hypothetical protein